jgi:hypothetical protein
MDFFSSYRVLNLPDSIRVVAYNCKVSARRHSFFSFSKGKVGYSGTATFCRDCALPFAAEEGLTGVLRMLGDPITCSLLVGGNVL